MAGWKGVLMIIEKPYFMSNTSWFVFDEVNIMYILTEKATEKARQSYNDFYEKLSTYMIDEDSLNS